VYFFVKFVFSWIVHSSTSMMVSLWSVLGPLLFAQCCSLQTSGRYHNTTQHPVRYRHYGDYMQLHLLPPSSTSSQNYSLWPRPHSQQLTQWTGHLTDSNFLQECFPKILSINFYHVNFHCFYSFVVMKLCFISFLLNKYLIGLDHSCCTLS